jgi:hypothetical protein
LRSVCALIVFASIAHAQSAGIQHARVRVDVRDRQGKPITNIDANQLNDKLMVRSDVTNEKRGLVREGNVFVVEGLLEGPWSLEVDGAPRERITVRDGRTYGVVWVQDYRAKKTRAPIPAAQRCESRDGTAIESFTFDTGALGGGWLTVKKAGKLVCSAVIAGGGATLYLAPGDYVIEATLVDGKKFATKYSFSANRPPPPLLLGRRK